MLDTRLSLIKDANPELFDRLKSYALPQSIDLELFNSESGDANLLYKNISLHCRQNPQTEALREFNRIKPGPSTIVIIMGLGLGYFVKRLYIGSKCKMVVYEPDLNILKFTLESVDFSGEINSGRLFITNTLEELENTLNELYKYKNQVTVTQVPYVAGLYPQKISDAMQQLDKIVPSLNSNYATLFKYSKKWLLQGFTKLTQAKNNSSLVILENKLKDKTALIVSAGPSLDKNIGLIKQNRDKFIIFCVNTAYKKLITEGIIPDFTVYLDLIGLKSIMQYEHSQTNMIIHSSCNSQVFTQLEPNRFFTFYGKNDLLSRWLAKTCGFSIENYSTKGSVAYLALVSAYNMGCNPIILTGQDLAYTEGKFYSSGTFWGDMFRINESNEIVEEKDLKDKETFKNKINSFKETKFVNVKAQDGGTVVTSADYAGFISHFESFVRDNTSEVRLLNCSTGGANIEGFENKTLQEALTGLPPVGLDINKTLQAIINTEKDPIINRWESIKSGLKPLETDKEKLLQAAQRGINNCKELSREIRNKKLNPVRIKTLYSDIMNSYNRLDENFFDKYDFAIGVAFEELTEFNLLMQDESPQGDFAMIVNFAKTARRLFEATEKGINGINARISSLDRQPEE